MKPNFALNLSHEGAELLHRRDSGWEVLGAARFDQDDLDARMVAMRQMAEERAPGGVYSKLVMPAGEMRYAKVLAPGPTDEARKLQIEAEIDGLTPYTADELAYDYVLEGDHALVAMAAREIMAEAEAFAVNHGFNPVSFVATPQEGAYHGEPFLGRTSVAAKLLPKKARVEPDTEPLRVVETMQAAEKQAETAQEPVALMAAAGGAARSRGPAPGARAAAPARPTRPRVEINPPERPRSQARPGAAFEKPEAGESSGMAKVGGLVRRMGNRLRREQARSDVDGAQPKGDGATTATGSPARDVQRDGGAMGRADAGGRPGSGVLGAVGARLARLRSGGDASRPVAEPVAETKAAAGRAVDDEAAAQEKPPAADERGPDAAAAAPVAFASRRRGTSPRLASSGEAQPSRGPGPGGRLAILPAAEGGTGGESARPARLGAVTAGAGAAMRRLRSAGKRLKATFSRRAVPAASGQRAEQPPRNGKRGMGLGGKGLSLSNLRRPSASADEPEPIVPESRPPADQAAKASEAEALTIFGARGGQQPDRGLPRRGLMAVGGVALLLIAVAVWAVYFSAGAPREPELATPVPDPAGETAAAPEIEAPSALPAPEADAPPAETTATAPAPEAEAPTAPDAAAAPDPAVLLEQLVEDGLRELAPADLLGGGDPAEPAPAAPDDATRAATESGPSIAPVPSEDATASGAPVLGFPAPVDAPAIRDEPLASVPVPPPFGVAFELGPDGLVEATPEGALTPAGITVFADRPAAVPPARPAGLAPAPPEPAPEPEPEPAAASPAPEPEPEPAATAPAPEPEPAEAPPEVVPDDTPRADPALADARPAPRSARVAEIGEAMAREQEAEAATEEAAPTDAPTEEGVPADAPAQPDPDDSGQVISPGGVSLAALSPQRRPTDLVPPAAPSEAVAESEDTLSEAVARSLLPSARPADMSERVAQALAAARRSPAPTAQPAAATPSPSAGPRIPTSASVAEQATERGMNLRRVNLIGVYGTSSERRAMVRLANGRIVRVGVGDRLDGGQVAAIGDSELRYVRNGRNRVIRIGGRS